MENIVRKDVLHVLAKTLTALQKPEPNFVSLRHISNQTLHNSSIFQDPYSISVGTLIYSLSKVIERLGPSFDLKPIIACLEKAIKCLSNNKEEVCSDCIKRALSLISKADEQYGQYVQHVINQARIRKGSGLYKHGLSATKTADLLGVSLWELYDYFGATHIFDQDTDISSVRQRLKYTRSLFT